jgi:hypothetical protein
MWSAFSKAALLVAEFLFPWRSGYCIYPFFF